MFHFHLLSPFFVSLTRINIKKKYIPRHKRSTEIKPTFIFSSLIVPTALLLLRMIVLYGIISYPGKRNYTFSLQERKRLGIAVCVGAVSCYAVFHSTEFEAEDIIKIRSHHIETAKTISC